MAFVCVLGLFGCASPQATEPPDTRAADEAAIRKLDEAWVKAAQTKSADAFVAYYAAGAVVLPPNDPIAASPETIKKAIDALMALPGMSISWKATKVEVSRSGDLAYLYGTYELTFKDDKGKPVSDHGKMVEIWKKQADGGWKCIVDTWNTDVPMAPPKKG
ncbi:MAG: DUF4440 domain-containing protein [Acidobacteria bacterium]|nr:DUF4440 domain-containing protein [Acidobacteriota bacterium]